MAFNVNTNVGSLAAQNNAAKTEGALNKAMTRLSSGLRVNGAADDAAGLAIAKNMSKQVSGYEVNVRNANDAVSLLQVAEGGMDEVGNMLQRMKDLALQSANGTNNNSERTNMNLEFQQLIAEIDRVVNTTSFNGQNLLSTFSTDFQVDESNQTNDRINVAIGDIRTSALGVDSGTATVLGSGISSVTDAFTAGASVTVANGTANAVTITVAANDTVQSLIERINADTATTGISATYDTDGTNGGHLALRNSTGGALDVVVDTTLQIGGVDKIAAATTSVASSGGQSIATQSGANAAIAQLDTAIGTITSERAQIGASQNRFDKAISNLSNKIVNVSAAMGRIMDADFGKETAEFSKQSIIQQAGISMMAQAKSMPQQLLSLLQ